MYPDAATLKEARAEINAWSYAVQDDGTLAPGFWRRLPIEVTVTREGYRTVKLTYRIDEPPAPVIAELASEAK